MMKVTGMRFEERLRKLEALEAAQADQDAPALLCVTEGDWEALSSPATSASDRQALGARYGVDGERLPVAKVYIGICLCWGDGQTCPVCEETR